MLDKTIIMQLNNILLRFQVIGKFPANENHNRIIESLEVLMTYDFYKIHYRVKEMKYRWCYSRTPFFSAKVVEFSISNLT